MVLLSLFLFQCDRNDVTPPQGKEEKDPYSISSTQALEVAQKYVATLQKNSGKSGARTSTEITDQKTILDEADKKPLFHIINRSKGFTIVSADARTMPVLAFSEESRFNPDTTNMPFGIKDWLENTKLKIKDVKKKNVNPDSVVIKEWRKYLSGDLNLPNKGARVSSTSCYEWYQYGQFMCQNTSTVRGPLLTTEWGQRGISSGALTWGSKNCDGCNRFLAGCGPVAMAQVWEYYRPDLSRPRTSNYSCTVSTTGETSLATLMHVCGIAASSSYDYFGSCNTFTWPNDVRSGLSNMGLSNGGNSSAAYNYQTIKMELLGNHPLIFWGSTCLACFSNYHIWVADGIQENNYSEFSCETLQCNTWAYSYIHMNWGWAGDSNGWFAFGQYNPNGNNYNANLHIISGIRN